MLLVVENALIEVGNAPAQRNVVNEKFGQLCSCLGGVGVTPCAERHEDVLILVESHVAVHHGREAYGGENLYIAVVLGKHFLAQVGIAVLESIPYSFHAIRPKTIDKLVFPLVAALSYRFVLLVDENCLDTGRAKLDTENGLTLLDSFFCCHNSYFNALFNM